MKIMTAVQFIAFMNGSHEFIITPSIAAVYSSHCCCHVWFILNYRRRYIL